MGMTSTHPAQHPAMAARPALVSVIPAAPRLPSDLAELDALDPISATFKSWGRLDELQRNSARMDLAAAETVRPGSGRARAA